MNKHKERKEYSLSKNKVWTIYKHTCILNGYSYIGQTFCSNIYDRFGKNGINYAGTLFGDMITILGWNNFTHEIIETGITSLKLANERECYWIGFYRTWTGFDDCKGYNTMRGGGNNWYIASQETRTKMSLAKLGSHHTDEYNAALSAQTGFGKILCIETGIIYYSAGDAFRKTKIRHILECCHKHRTIAGGYHWAFVMDLARINELSEFFGKDRHITKFAKRKVKCLETNEIFESITAAKKKYPGCISKVLSGERELAAGFHWEYVND